jgi:serine protein kinase
MTMDSETHGGTALGAGATDAHQDAGPSTFEQYLELVRQRPEVAESAHARLYRMIERAGRTVRDGRTEWQFFSRHLFGLGETVDALVEDYLHPAAVGLEVKRRLLLLMGPVGGGKSTLVWLLKRGLEAFTRTEEGALWAIRGCPMQEEPLHLVPPVLRAEWGRQLGVEIVGDLCPMCRFRLEYEHHGRFLEVPVERVVFSEASRVGLGTFVPSDPKSQDMADLTGALDFSTITRYGSESDPRAFRFDGELYAANRGLMEFQEMLKLDEKFLYHLLGLTQENTFKAGRFALIHADEVVVGHTNEAEFRAFAQNPRNEALLSRMVVIRVPYPLSVEHEAAIYRKQLEGVTRPVHFAPGALEAAAAVSVLSRLNPSDRPGLDPLVKLAVLNGETPRGVSPEDVETIRDEAKREGMTGIDPRYVVNRLSSAVIRTERPCLTAVDVLKALREGVDQHGVWTRLKAEDLRQWIALAKKRYDQEARQAVQRAYLAGHEEDARALFHNYLDHVEASLWPSRRIDPLTGQRMEADENLLRGIEDALGVSDVQRRSFREEVWLRVSATGRREAWDYRVHPELQQAIEDRLFLNLREMVQLHQDAGDVLDAKWQDLVRRLQEDGAFCPHCAEATLKYVGSQLGR